MRTIPLSRIPTRVAALNCSMPEPDGSLWIGLSVYPREPLPVTYSAHQSKESEHPTIRSGALKQLPLYCVQYNDGMVRREIGRPVYPTPPVTWQGRPMAGKRRLEEYLLALWMSRLRHCDDASGLVPQCQCTEDDDLTPPKPTTPST